MVTIDKVLAEVAAAEPTTAEDTARAHIKALGLEVNEKTREVYNPAEGSYSMPRYPTTQPTSMVPRQVGPTYSRYSRASRRR